MQASGLKDAKKNCADNKACNLVMCNLAGENAHCWIFQLAPADSSSGYSPFQKYTCRNKNLLREVPLAGNLLFLTHLLLFLCQMFSGCDHIRSNTRSENSQKLSDNFYLPQTRIRALSSRRTFKFHRIYIRILITD